MSNLQYLEKLLISNNLMSKTKNYLKYLNNSKYQNITILKSLKVEFKDLK